MSHTIFFKILILGDSNVGKTSMMMRYTTNTFSTSYKATIGADFLTKTILLDDKKITLQCWDTAGKERFQSLGTSFYRGTDGALFVYDVTNPSSLKHLTKWKNQFNDLIYGLHTHLGANGPCAKVDKRRVGSELVYIDQVGPVGGSSFIRSWGYCPYCRGDYKGTSANRAQFVVDIRHEANVNY
jgi:small GTP-binding protein